VIRVVLVEDQHLVRDGLRSLLGLLDDVRVVGEAADGAEAVALIGSAVADVVLLDVRMPRMNGLEVLRQLHREDRLPPTIMLTTFDDPEALFEAIRAGARGFMLKDVTLDQLAEAIRAVATGGSSFQPGLTERLLRAVQQRGIEPEICFAAHSLSPRERDVVRLMAGGFRNREIAEAFGLAEGTVKNHVSNILSKLGVRERTRAVLVAISRGIV